MCIYFENSRQAKKEKKGCEFKQRQSLQADKTLKKKKGKKSEHASKCPTSQWGYQIKALFLHIAQQTHHRKQALTLQSG